MQVGNERPQQAYSGQLCHVMGVYQRSSDGVLYTASFFPQHLTQFACIMFLGLFLAFSLHLPPLEHKLPEGRESLMFTSVYPGLCTLLYTLLVLHQNGSHE